MPLNPCIADSDCVSLAVDANSDLVASLIISPTAGNCAECTASGLYVNCAELSLDACNAAEARADGFWVPEVTQGFAQDGPPTVPYDTLVVAGPLAPAGEIVARTGTIDFTAPTCGDGILLRAEIVGPVQVEGISVGGRVITGYQSRVLPNPYTGGPYAVWRNSGTVTGEIGWPVTTPTPIISTIAAGTSLTLEWKQTYEVTAGTVGTITFRSVFIYLWSVHIAA